MNQKEIESVVLLEPFERYKYFIKKVADWEIFFTLLNEDGNYALSKLDNYELFPLWSAREFAELCKINGWEKYSIKELSLDDLENEIIDFIIEGSYLINVFPIYDKTGFVVNLQEFTRDLNDELEKIQ
ncbi:DUF2750 domain-containing protein [Riemerella anatipestifer]|uniref:DUF2750 domain-containing protein n=1 Tax=Riemerella anatipestifer TaxID=34085 RepID=A0A1S7DU09_RIEAN|nr:DUF2750 domain-containing protein [Riemerella anatipestifer]AQY22605.1 hypothetical protein AB406_1661 [Riemerella anatipestifer]MBO4232719.1 DUF2750 domain-containing protein [Riemerella anatipestifer]MCO4303627.1 DUF2750 domain-containing protein [Riemerella anatipestifer]MCO7352190.1 DUF2750 domain-containing protein [Riemerella anatipestifer]MCQ4040058.1 DUF2750 domain-containing protein [Riemerella anatipestifer]